MNEDTIRELLQAIQDGALTPEKALQQLKKLPYENLEFARIDHHRSLRSGLSEVIYCRGKSVEQLKGIVTQMLNAQGNVLGTHLLQDQYLGLKEALPENHQYNNTSKTLVIQQKDTSSKAGIVLVASAGTSDIPVAEEAAVTARFFGSQTQTLFDVGVAGIHRLFDKMDVLHKARVVIVVAGMDGALPSVVGGLVDKPVIAVPTSVGYGAAFGGVSALLAMLNSCSPGLATMNIDNGFGAGCLAHKINLLGEISDPQ